MEIATLFALLFRWLHILAAMIAVGGTVFARAVVVPSVDEQLPNETRAALHAAMRARWSKIVAAAIAALLVSGLYNFTMTAMEYKLPRWYHLVFGTKFMLALT